MLIFRESKTKKGKTVISNKFWNGVIVNTGTEFVVKCSWGRIGSKGQSNEKPFDSELGAKRFLEEKEYSKIMKGYSKSDDNEYKRLCLTAKIVGLNNRVNKSSWYEKTSDGSWKELANQDEINNPGCEPALFVSFTEGKTSTTHEFIFSNEGTYDLTFPPIRDTFRGNLHTIQLIDESHPMFEMSSKIMEAVLSY